MSYFETERLFHSCSFLKHQIFGYDCEHGQCLDLITGNNHSVSTIIAISHWMPGSIMVLSYSVIWVHIWTNGKYLKRTGHNDIKKALIKREIQFIKTFFIVILFYIICGMATSIKLVDTGIFAKHSGLLRVIVFFWYLQFSLNCFIYAVKSEQYRKAYSFFLQQVTKPRRNCKSCIQYSGFAQ